MSPLPHQSHRDTLVPRRIANVPGHTGHLSRQTLQGHMSSWLLRDRGKHRQRMTVRIDSAKTEWEHGQSAVGLVSLTWNWSHYLNPTNQPSHQRRSGLSSLKVFLRSPLQCSLLLITSTFPIFSTLIHCAVSTLPSLHLPVSESLISPSGFPSQSSEMDADCWTPQAQGG